MFSRHSRSTTVSIGTVALGKSKKRRDKNKSKEDVYEHMGDWQKRVFEPWLQSFAAAEFYLFLLAVTCCPGFLIYASQTPVGLQSGDFSMAMIWITSLLTIRFGFTTTRVRLALQVPIAVRQGDKDQLIEALAPAKWIPFIGSVIDAVKRIKDD